MPAVDSFDDLFGTETMSSMVERFATAVSGRPFTAEYRRGERLEPSGDSVKWDEVRFSRDLARLTGPDSPTKAAAKTRVKVRTAVMVDIKEHVDLPARFLYLMRDPGSLEDNARAKIDRELRNCASKLANTIEYICTKAAEGSLNLSTVPNSELTPTLTYPVLAIAANANWSTAGTKIRSDEINALKDTYMKKSGMMVQRAIAHHAIEDFITANTELTNFIKEGSLAARSLESSFLDGGAAPMLGGIRWNFTNAHYAQEATPDTEVEFLTVDRAILLPSEAETADGLCMAEGRVHIPAGPVYGDVAGTPGNLLTERRGFWAYAEVVSNPPTIRIHSGWKGLPIQKLANLVANYDSTPT